MGKFYEYMQNNSGGYYVKGPMLLIIEADSAVEADMIAEENGAYFYGVHKGYDCKCCGDRWGTFWGTPTDVPMYYNRVIPPEYGDEGTIGKDDDLAYWAIDYKIVRKGVQLELF